jgi:hypothetical protein
VKGESEEGNEIINLRDVQRCAYRKRERDSGVMIMRRAKSCSTEA